MYFMKFALKNRIRDGQDLRQKIINWLGGYDFTAMVSVVDKNSSTNPIGNCHSAEWHSTFW